MRGLGLPGCGLGRDRADLDEAEAHRAQAVDAAAVLVQARGQADAVGEPQARQLHRVVDARLPATGIAPACSAAAPARRASGRGRLRRPGRTGRGGSGRREAAAWHARNCSRIRRSAHAIIAHDPGSNSRPWSGRPRWHYVLPGTVVGVGTGSTVNHFIEALGTMKERIAGAVSSSEREHRAPARAGHRGARRQRGRAHSGVHRRRRRDRRPGLHDQGRRRRADAREDRRRPGRALRLHCRRIQARGTARALRAAGGGDPDGRGAGGAAPGGAGRAGACRATASSPTTAATSSTRTA